MMKSAYILITVILLGLPALPAQNVLTSGLSQLQGPIWMVEGPTRLELVADLNGDGQLDLVHRTLPNAAFPDRMKASLSTPDGGYAQESLALQLPVGTRKLICGEFNGDGLPDLIVETDASSPGFGQALVIRTLNGTGVANGSFNLMAALPFPLQLLIAADLEGDGDDDLAIMLVDGIGQSLLLWVETLGSGAFAPRPAYILPPTSTYTRMGLGDLNGDGILDVGLLTPTGVERYITAGSSFSTMPTVPHGLPSVGGDTSELSITDLDGDGDLDYVVTESAADGFQVILDQGGSFGMGPVLPSAKTNPSNFVRRLVGIGDVDGDGLPEIVFHDRSNTAFSTDYGSLEYYSGAAALNPQITLSLPFNPASGFAFATWQPRRLVDLDGNGALDIVGNAGVIFGLPNTAKPLQTLTQRGLLFDADKDGDLDIVEPGVLRRNDGRGVFESTSSGTSRLPILPPSGLAAVQYHLNDGFTQADFNGDGRLDLITTALVTPFGAPPFEEARLLLGNADGTLSDQGSAASGQRILGTAQKPHLVADTDGDGDLDILVKDFVWVNDGSNHFTPNGSVIAGFSPIQAIQFDSDPGLEILLRLSTPGAPGLFLLDPLANGTLILYQVSPSLTGSELMHDLDDDGDIDLIFQDFLLGQLFILENQGGLLSVTWGSAPGVFSLAKVLAGDIDGDGATDFVLGDQVYINQTPGNVLGFARQGILGYAAEQLADLDQDGDLDFFGGVVQMNRQLSGLGAGFVRQYGKGSQGSAGLRPILGASGPLRTTSTSASLNLSNALGATSSVLFVGFAPDATPDFMLPGLTSYVAFSSLITTYNLSLGGLANIPGEGELSIPLTIPPTWTGLRIYLQASFVDPGVPVAYSVSNGLELVFGN